MGIFQSGLIKPVMVTCIKPLSASGVTFEVGKNYQLMLDMGNMYVLKSPSGEEAIVPKDAFKLAKE